MNTLALSPRVKQLRREGSSEQAHKNGRCDDKQVISRCKEVYPGVTGKGLFHYDMRVASRDTKPCTKKPLEERTGAENAAGRSRKPKLECSDLRVRIKGQSAPGTTDVNDRAQQH
jgi:hypothetical protein